MCSWTLVSPLPVGERHRGRNVIGVVTPDLSVSDVTGVLSMFSYSRRVTGLLFDSDFRHCSNSENGFQFVSILTVSVRGRKDKLEET